MMLAGENPLESVLDHPWRIGGQTVPWMSSQIAMMLAVGLLLAVGLPLISRRRGLVPRGAYRVVEMLVLLVRNGIANPAMGPAGRGYIPYLATLLVFLLGMNLGGLAPLVEISKALGLRDTPIGGPATASIYVCGGLAGLTLAILTLGGYFKSVRRLWKGPGEAAHEEHKVHPGLNLVLALSEALQGRRWPLPVAAVAAIPVWLNNFVPPVPGIVGLVLWPMLLLVEIVGYVFKTLALCIRLFVNMVSGHLLMGVLLLLVAGGSGWAIGYVSLPTALANVMLLMLDLIVAVIQAYIFTFLTALYIGLAMYPRH